jgi:hypothetical protein
MSDDFHISPVFRGRHSDYWYLERLPPDMRQVLCNAAFDWSAGWIYTQWCRGKPGWQTGTDIAVRIAEADAKQISKDRQRVWSFE